MMRILFCGAECTPFAKTGGLADVIGALPKEFKGDVDVIMPAYRGILEGLNTEDIQTFYVKELNRKAEVILYHKDSINYYFVINDFYYDRDSIYNQPDDAERFAFFNIVIKKFALKRGYDIVHCHDWHTGMVPFLLRGRIKTVFTIHNLAYQGSFSKDTADLFNKENREFYIWGNFNYMKIGIMFADIITTVSKTYSKEILTKEFGCGLEDVLKSREDDLYGIINGIDYTEFNPEIDKALEYTYNSDTWQTKSKNKHALQEELNLPKSDNMMISVISRLTEQKGIDLLAEIMPKMVKLDIQFILLGSGDKKFEQKLMNFNELPNVSINIGYNDPLARRIYASSDLFLMPSKYEPCGLSQLISYKYGTLPLVRSTGGLKDTVKDYGKGGLGFVFDEYSAEAFFRTVLQANNVYSTGVTGIAKAAMELDFSFSKSKEEYMRLYRRV